MQIDEVDRNHLVCASKGCTRCPISQSKIPADCEYVVKHCLEEQEFTGKVEYRPCRSGKTTKIVDAANLLASVGYDVLIFTRTWAERMALKENVPLHDNIQVLLDTTLDLMAHQVGPYYFLFDEVEPSGFIKNTIDCYSNHCLLGGFLTGSHKIHFDNGVKVMSNIPHSQAMGVRGRPSF